VVALACQGGANDSARDPASATPATSISGTFEDEDGDGIASRDDNCPIAPNPDQSDLDENASFDARSFVAGDACDEDMDGDGITNDRDLFPRDTDNDGRDNEVDKDDDGDDVGDDRDNCVLVANRGQKDTDSDGAGDHCDADTDDDELPDFLELIFLSDPFDEESTIEYVDFEQVCEDGDDNDRDGRIDAQDEGCVDSDADSYADYWDNCPNDPNIDQFDSDDDDVGDVCDPDSPSDNENEE
jgi:hypothetical protein